jgi:putative ATP-dependent endonuclease of OLD family
MSNFRSCRDTVVWFQDDLTVLVGENNSGKSNVVDAVRLVTAPSDGRRARFCEPADLSFDSGQDWLDLRTVYGGLSLAEQALFLSASTGVDSADIAYRLRYDAPAPHERRGRTTWTVGANDSPDPEPAARDRIRHVYLPPLRDAQQALASGTGDRIEFVLKALAADAEVETLEASAAQAFDELAADPLIRRASDSVAEQVTELSRSTIPHTSSLGFVEPKLRQLARALRVKLNEAGLDLVDLSHSGLGYANLLFLSTVVVELEATRDADLTLFLVEEPEAHLHPQLQTAVLDFLMSAARENENNPSDIQVVVTTHSAQLASAVPSARVEVIKTTSVILGDDSTARNSKTVPVWRLDVAAAQRRKVDRYINATRSPMLFGPRVMLVEGIAEALLLPSLARRFLGSAEQVARFRGVALVAIDGVDFEPYLRLLLLPHDGICIAHRVVVVTDKDPNSPGDRVAALEQLAVELEAPGRLVVEAAEITLEASLFQAGNVDCLREGFLAQRPQSEHVWDDLMEKPASDRAAELMKILREKSILKGDLAQHVAARVEANEDFWLPEYLHRALVEALE